MQQNKRTPVSKRKLFYTRIININKSIKRKETGREKRLIRAHKHIKERRSDKVRKTEKVYIHIS